MSTGNGGSPGVRLRAIACALAMLLLLPSCFTTMLWETDPKPQPRAQRAARSDDGESPLRSLLLRIVLTPLTLALDCLTWPAQEWLHEDHEDDEQKPRRRPRGC